MPLSATRGHWVVRGEQGLAAPNVSLPKLSLWRAITYQDLPTHSLLFVKCRLCCVEAVLLWLCVWKKYACTSLSITPPVYVCTVCTHVFLRGGQNSWFQKEVSLCQQEHRLACLSVKNKAVCSLLELHTSLATQRKNVHSVLTQHMRFVDICTATEANSTSSLKCIEPLCCSSPLHLKQAQCEPLFII